MTAAAPPAAAAPQRAPAPALAAERHPQAEPHMLGSPAYAARAGGAGGAGGRGCGGRGGAAGHREGTPGRPSGAGAGRARAAAGPRRSAPSRVLLRACSCDEPGASPCTSCAGAGAGRERLARSPAGTAAAVPARTHAPSSVRAVLASPGRPLDPAVRAPLEERLGADLGAVRVHTDAAAAASAADVQASAYTVGPDVVFGHGGFDPSTSSGRRLLAHELVHVVQQQGASRGGPLLVGAPDHPLEHEAHGLADLLASSLAAPPAAASAPAPAAAVVPAPAAAVVQREPATAPPAAAPPGPGCDTGQWAQATAAVTNARSWLNKTDVAVSAFLDAPTGGATPRVPAALGRHFKTRDPQTVRYVLDKLRQIAQKLAGFPVSIRAECHAPPADPMCADFHAHASEKENLMVLCSQFFTEDLETQTKAVVHELAHTVVPTGSAMFVTDRAYLRERMYRELTTGEAITNADSYGRFVQEVANDKDVVSTAPTDKTVRCDASWVPAIDRAMAEAQRWNTDVLNSLDSPGRTFQGLMDKHLGGHAAADVATATFHVRRLSGALDTAVTFECEEVVTSSNRGWEVEVHTPDVTVYNLFRTLPDDEKPTAILRAMYTAFGEATGNGGYERYFTALAHLAHDTHAKQYAGPTPSDVKQAVEAPSSGAPPAPPVPAPAPPAAPGAKPG